MYDVTKLLPRAQFDALVRVLPTPRQRLVGRKRCWKEAMLTGILQVLVMGIGWNTIFDCGCSPSSCWRYFKELQRRGILKKRFTQLAGRRTDISECAIDTDSATSYRFQRGTGWDGRHKKIATKISLLSDKIGLPADVLFGSGTRHDKGFVDQHLKNTAGRRRRVLNLDKIYVSLELRRALRRKGIKVNMKMRSQDYRRKRGPKFKLNEVQYRVRFLIEKTFAWMENFRRCKYRVEYKLAHYKAFVYLALLIILIRS